MLTKDPCEEIISAALDAAEIRYTREGQGQTLDFYLPDLGVYIEVKQFYTHRSDRQLASQFDVILIQGRNAARAFARIVSHETT